MAEPFDHELGHFYLEPIMNYAVFVLELITIIIILAILAITIIDLFKISISGLRKSQEKQQQREHMRAIVSRMLRGLLISLDFLIATDIIQTILVPSLFELAQLAIVVIIRILLSWSLSKELESR